VNKFSIFAAKVWAYKSALVLILANLIPLGSVLLLGWNAFDIVFLYWMENLVIGGFNIVKMLICGAVGNPVGEDNGPKTPRLAVLSGTLFLIAFFTFHYGLFCMVHGFFVTHLFGKSASAMVNSPLDLVHYAVEATRGRFGSSILALILSHGFSFIANYLMGGEYKKVRVNALFVAPYGRIVLLHIALLLGAFTAMMFGSPITILVLLVLGKISLDLILHLQERERGVISWKQLTP